MRIFRLDGESAGLHFAILIGRANPAHEISVRDCGPAGVVFFDAKRSDFGAADPDTHTAILTRCRRPERADGDEIRLSIS